jgi:uncharacterized membrane protein (DUF4010 family)
LADVDPITLSVAKMVGTARTAQYASAAILIAVSANLAAKCALAVFFGGSRFAMPLIATAALVIATGGSIAAFLYS